MTEHTTPPARDGETRCPTCEKPLADCSTNLGGRAQVCFNIACANRTVWLPVDTPARDGETRDGDLAQHSPERAAMDLGAMMAPLPMDPYSVAMRMVQRYRDAARASMFCPDDVSIEERQRIQDEQDTAQAVLVMALEAWQGRAMGTGQQLAASERDGETLSGEQTVTGGGDPIMGALSMFRSYIRCGDSWDACAQQAYDRAGSAVAALRAECARLTADKERLDAALIDASAHLAFYQELAESRTPRTNGYADPVMIDGIPRAGRMDYWTPAEHAIHEAVDMVERAGCDLLLTDAVNLLGDARGKVAEYIDREIQAGRRPATLTSKAAAEIGAFRDHLTNHLNGELRPGCRFCDIRNAPRAGSNPFRPGQRVRSSDTVDWKARGVVEAIRGPVGVIVRRDGEQQGGWYHISAWKADRSHAARAAAPTPGETTNG